MILDHKAHVRFFEIELERQAPVHFRTHEEAQQFYFRFATEFIPDAESLADLLFRSSDRQIDAEKTLHISGEVVRTLEDTHVLHPDVNAGNILLREHDGVIEAHVIDLDRCNVLTRAAPVRPRFMRDRLERSLRKLGELHAVQVSDAGWQALRDGFEARP